MIGRTIEVDFDVHRCIENERRSFEETPNDALRRLLKLGEAKPVPPEQPDSAPTRRKSWSDKGVTLPHGTMIRMSYANRRYDGQIIDGMWVVGDQAFNSPSGAAGGIALTKAGTPTQLNGWNYWEVKLPAEDDWKPLRSMLAAVTLADLGL
jgi:hypothetical protein